MNMREIHFLVLNKSENSAPVELVSNIILCKLAVSAEKHENKKTNTYQAVG